MLILRHIVLSNNDVCADPDCALIPKSHEKKDDDSTINDRTDHIHSDRTVRNNRSYGMYGIKMH